MIRFLNWLKSLFEKKQTQVEVVKPSEGTAMNPDWMAIAEKELGVKEVSGSGDNARILEYHSKTKLKATDDEIAWCASFVCWVLETSGRRSTKSARARDYLLYGEHLDEPKYGCIVVLDRGEGKGHVGFYVSDANGMIKILGGNQSDSVCYSLYPKRKVLGYRMPLK